MLLRKWREDKQLHRVALTEVGESGFQFVFRFSVSAFAPFNRNSTFSAFTSVYAYLFILLY